MEEKLGVRRPPENGVEQQSFGNCGDVLKPSACPKSQDQLSVVDIQVIVEAADGALRFHLDFCLGDSMTLCVGKAGKRLPKGPFHTVSVCRTAVIETNGSGFQYLTIPVIEGFPCNGLDLCLCSQLV